MWWALVFEMSLWLNGGIAQYEPWDPILIEHPISTEILMTGGLGCFYLEGGVTVDMFMEKMTNFIPMNNTYLVRAGLDLGAVNLGIEHACYHPMIPYQWVPDRHQLVPSFEGWQTRVFARISVKGGRR